MSMPNSVGNTCAMNSFRALGTTSGLLTFNGNGMFFSRLQELHGRHIQLRSDHSEALQGSRLCLCHIREHLLDCCTELFSGRLLFFVVSRAPQAELRLSNAVTNVRLSL